MYMTPENLLNSSLKGKRASLAKRYQKLENDRSSWRSHWMEITDYILPRRGRYLQEHQNSKGRKRSSKVVDSTAVYSLRTLSAGLVSGLTSPSRPWFRLETDEERMDMPGVKSWLGDVERTLRSLLSSTNFYNSAATVYTELGAFGTSVVLRRGHPKRHVHYRPTTAGEYVIAENSFNEVDTFGRRFQMTVAQLVERFVYDPESNTFAWEKVSRATKKLWDDKNYDELVTVIHMVQPRRDEDRNYERMDGPNRPWMDCYFEEGADNDILLDESGYWRKPFFAPRWDLVTGDIYGTSPGMTVLGDVKQLQHEQRRKAQAIDKMVSPPMTAPPSMKGRPMTTMPSGVTYVDPQVGGAGFSPAYQINPNLGEFREDIMQVQDMIKRGFYADLFAMMLNSDRRQITATEVAERHEEKLVLLGPVLQRLNTELLDPLIEDLFLIAMDLGLLPPMPQALEGAEVTVKYVSLLAQAQEAVAAGAIERGMAFAGNLVPVFPEIADNVDPDKAYREYVGILGATPSMLREPDEVAEIRRSRAEQMQREQELQEASVAAGAANQGAQAAKVLAEADSMNPNALRAMLQQQQGAA